MVHHLLIDTERFVWPYVITRKQVIQLSKHRQFCILGVACTYHYSTDVFKIIMSPDSTFYKLYSDIYLAKDASTNDFPEDTPEGLQYP